ncbi:hypothetical protein T05_9693 [Trichinella murrelli]|uniref:Uncharacterized protein n=1 Tax=Trichinella murrelli TaxID=144512 RepID=A0A0V0TBF8_9BILA|nr:hypothetical protein T05_9693 [Trichinella murrelli]
MFEQGAFPPVGAPNAKGVRILVRIRVFHACCLCSPVQNNQTCRILRHQLSKGNELKLRSVKQHPVNKHFKPSTVSNTSTPEK